MGKWAKPKRADLMTPGGELLPTMMEIPKEFINGNHWTAKVEKWLYYGGRVRISAKEGIDTRKALRHAKPIAHDYDVDHTRKVAGLAYLFSLWFEEFDIETSIGVGSGYAEETTAIESDCQKVQKEVRGVREDPSDS